MTAPAGRRSPLTPDGDHTRLCPWWPSCEVITQAGQHGQQRHIQIVHKGARPHRSTTP